MRYSRFIKRVSDDFIRDFSGLGNPILLIALFLLVTEGDQLKTAIMGLALLLVIGYIIKLIFSKERPKKIDHRNLFELIQSRSFPSVHSAEIMYSGLVVIHFVNNVLIDLFFAIIIFMVGYSRYYLKKHYFTDIVFGYAIGFIVYALMF